MAAGPRQNKSDLAYRFRDPDFNFDFDLVVCRKFSSVACHSCTRWLFIGFFL